MSLSSTPGHDREMPVLHMSVEDLRREFVRLSAEKFSLNTEEDQLSKKIESLREESVRLQLSSEIEEEHAANQLMRRLEGAERDVRKYRLLLREEELSTEDLTRQIKEIRNQQSDVENQLEQQQEFRMLKLQKKLMEVADKKGRVETELMLDRQRYLDVLVNQLARLRGTSESDVSGTFGSGSASASAAAVPGGGEGGTSSAAVGKTGSLAQSSSAPPEAGGLPSVGQRSGVEHAMPTETASSHPITPDPAAMSASVERGGSASASESFTATPTPPPPPASSATHQAVLRLEQRLNTMLQEHIAAVQESAETERRCAELANKLKEIQAAAFLDRARAAKLKEDIRLARGKLASLEASTITRTDSLDDSSFSNTPNRSLDTAAASMLGSASLRDRTMQVLSTVPATSVPISRYGHPEEPTGDGASRSSDVSSRRMETPH